MKTIRYILGVAALGLLTVANSNQQLLAQDTVRLLDDVIIRDSRVSNKAPLTTSTISKDALQEQKAEVSIPYIIEMQPSVVATTENCNAGNTSLRIRGVDASRINFNINGITLNDAESQGVYWVNVPNLSGMAQSLQIQRGVGASNGGSPAFGGAINMQTLNANNRPYANVDLGYGSFNTEQVGILAGTGLTKRGFSFDMGYSGLSTDGSIRNGFSKQQSLFMNGGYYGERSLLKAIVILGKQTTGITWNGASAYDLDRDNTYNDAGAYIDDLGQLAYYDNETDNYSQRRYQLYYSYMPSEEWTINAALDFTHGDGYYENYKANKKANKYGVTLNGSGSTKSDFIIRKEMFNSAYTASLSGHYTGERLSLSFGENFLYYDGDHYGNLVWCRDSVMANHFEWYRNTGRKSDATTYLKAAYDINANLNLYADLQMRIVDYQLDGMDDDFTILDFEKTHYFFNPKAGVNWRLSDNQRTYFVAGLTHREPTRADIKDKLAIGETIKDETMLDLELGYQQRGERYELAANLYAMLYKDQLTASGKLSDVGYSLMENVDKSYRLGIELQGLYRCSERFYLDGNVTLSTNKIIDYTYTDFANGDTLINTVTGTTDLSFSPSVVGAMGLNFEPIKDLRLQLTGKYVGEMYGDNTSRDAYKQDAYFLLNFRASYIWHLRGNQSVEAQFVVRNILDHKYRVISWVYDYDDDSTPGVTYYYNSTGYLQQPGINYTARLVYSF